MQLQFGNLTDTVRESYCYSTGILQLQNGNLTNTLQEAYSYRTVVVGFIQSPITPPAQVLGLVLPVVPLPRQHRWHLLYYSGVCTCRCLRSMGGFVLVTSSRRVHTEKSLVCVSQSTHECWAEVHRSDCWARSARGLPLIRSSCYVTEHKFSFIFKKENFITPCTVCRQIF